MFSSNKTVNEEDFKRFTNNCKVKEKTETPKVDYEGKTILPSRVKILRRQSSLNTVDKNEIKDLKNKRPKSLLNTSTLINSFFPITEPCFNQHLTPQMTPFTSISSLVSDIEDSIEQQATTEEKIERRARIDSYLQTLDEKRNIWNNSCEGITTLD
ncbi:uncharacterized protein LOC100208193 [Hydra vulgaris]|uniref:uncharacterized protein LOC100208193 n=1 Tax=Hydra vulgaris TaxID=6087 RepID=UPI0001926859|nr:uncharacterized protein LOC100208193 [Hydra vulgaris]